MLFYDIRKLLILKNHSFRVSKTEKIQAFSYVGKAFVMNVMLIFKCLELDRSRTSNIFDVQEQKRFMSFTIF